MHERTSGGWGVTRCVWWFHTVPQACPVFTSPSWRRHRAPFLLRSSEVQAVWRATAAPWSSVILRPEYWPCPLHDAVRISLNLTSKFGHYLTHRQPWTASYFALTRAHQHGIAVGPRNGQSCVSKSSSLRRVQSTPLSASFTAHRTSCDLFFLTIVILSLFVPAILSLAEWIYLVSLCGEN